MLLPTGRVMTRPYHYPQAACLLPQLAWEVAEGIDVDAVADDDEVDV